jgi:hypothetical protein
MSQFHDRLVLYRIDIKAIAKVYFRYRCFCGTSWLFMRHACYFIADFALSAAPLAAEGIADQFKWNFQAWVCSLNY